MENTEGQFYLRVGEVLYDMWWRYIRGMKFRSNLVCVLRDIAILLCKRNFSILAVWRIEPLQTAAHRLYHYVVPTSDLSGNSSSS